MAGARLSELGSIWKTIREVDIAAIRHEAERDVVIACVGDRAAVDEMHGLLLGGPDRYPSPFSALGLVPLDQVRARERLVTDADLLVVALHADVTLDPAELAGLERLEALSPRRRLLVLIGDPAAPARSVLRRVDEGRSVVIRPRAAGARESLASAVLDALPPERRLAAARRLPGLRPRYAHQLTSDVSLSNGAFVVASGLPSLVPALGIPMAAADTLVLTKNQALMVYRLALAFGAPAEFQKRMIEITPVIGAAVVWRQVAGGLVGLIPGYGIVPKTVVAFAGTWITGRAAELYYASGLVSREDLRRFSDEAMARARAMAGEMTRRAREARGGAKREGEGGQERGGEGERGAEGEAGRATRLRRGTTGRLRKGTGRLREGTGRLREGARKLTPRRKSGAQEEPQFPSSPPAPPDAPPAPPDTAPATPAPQAALPADPASRPSPQAPRDEA